MKIFPGGEELPLTAWAEIKLCTARLRGHQCGIALAEAYKSLDGHVIGNRILQQIVQQPGSRAIQTLGGRKRNRSGSS